MKENINYKNKKIAEISSYLDIERYKGKDLYKFKNNFIDYLVGRILLTSNNYAGFGSKKDLQKFIQSRIFDLQAGSVTYERFPTEKILLGIKNAFKKIYPILPSKELVKIYLFPTWQDFVKDRMSGINGFTPNGNSMHLYLHHKIKSQKKFLVALKEILAHEYNHVIRFQYFKNSSSASLLETIIFEGLAENFRMEALKGKISPWAGSLEVDVAKKIFKKIQPLLQLPSQKNYYAVFFENKEFPLWAGYGIGYQLVREFRKRNSDIGWPKIMQMNCREIFKKSGWQ